MALLILLFLLAQLIIILLFFFLFIIGLYCVEVVLCIVETTLLGDSRYIILAVGVVIVLL